MRVLILGAGRTGSQVIQQLRKNEAIEIVTADPRPEPHALEHGLIERVDIREVITPLTLDAILAKARPDLILMAMPTEEMGLGTAPGVEILADALRDEIAGVSRTPVIEVARVTQ